MKMTIIVAVKYLFKNYAALRADTKCAALNTVTNVLLTINFNQAAVVHLRARGSTEQHL